MSIEEWSLRGNWGDIRGDIVDHTEQEPIDLGLPTPPTEEQIQQITTYYEEHPGTDATPEVPYYPPQP